MNPELRAAGRRHRLRTCGELGGRTLSGKPCVHAAGFGTGHRGEGHCRKHDEPATEAIKQAKTRFLELLEAGQASLGQACGAIGLGGPQLWRWRKADPAFDAAVVGMRKMRDEIDARLVEESLVKRLISGNHSPVEIIFFLKNRDPVRWSDRRIVQHAGATTLEETLRQIADDEASGHELAGLGDAGRT